jgi:hypothetical protein
MPLQRISFALLEDYLASRLPPSAYAVEYGDSSNGRFISISPSEAQAAQLTVWPGENDGICDFCFGKAFFREIDGTDGEDLLELVDAVLRGNLVESIWLLGRHQLYSKSILRLNDGRAVIRNGIWLFYPPWLKHTYTYKPFLAA